MLPGPSNASTTRHLSWSYREDYRCTLPVIWYIHAHYNRTALVLRASWSWVSRSVIPPRKNEQLNPICEKEQSRVGIGKCKMKNVSVERNFFQSNTSNRCDNWHETQFPSERRPHNEKLYTLKNEKTSSQIRVPNTYQLYLKRPSYSFSTCVQQGSKGFS